MNMPSELDSVLTAPALSVVQDTDVEMTEASCLHESEDEDSALLVLSYPQGLPCQARGMLPAYTGLMTLEELGLLYLLERCTEISKEGAYRMAQIRGVDADAARDIIDFYFIHGATASRQTSVVERDEDENEETQEASGRMRRPTIAQTMRLGDSDVEVITLPVKGSDQKLSVRDDFVAELSRAYPRVNVSLQLEGARMWLSTNPGKLKTPRGMGKFLNGWMRNSANDVAVRDAVTRVERQNASPFGVNNTGAPQIDSQNETAEQASATSGIDDIEAIFGSSDEAA